MNNFTESTIEQAASEWLQSLGYNYAFGPEITFFHGESQTQASLRDSLPPKLMRGEVRVKDVGIS